MIYKNHVSSIYHPTSIALIDNNYNFLNSIANELRIIDKHIQSLVFTDPIEALEHLKQVKGAKQLLDKSIETEIHSEIYGPGAHQHPITINVSSLCNMIYEETCFGEISVVVVDFSMPKMDGSEFCHQLKLINSPVKIIMLTGQADAVLAVKLFNEGLIDKFILKSDLNLEKVLAASITEMQHLYFQDLTGLITQGLASDYNSCLGDPIFIQFFDKIRKEVSASSHYLIDYSGSFLLLDDNGLPTWLIIKTEDEINDLVEVMLETKNKPESIVNAINKMEKIPYYKDKDDYMRFMNAKTDKEIEKYLHQANLLIGEKRYAYFLTKELPKFELDQEGFVSFNQYIKKLAETV